MGRQVVISHSNYTKHVAQKELASQCGLANFFKPTSNSVVPMMAPLAVSMDLSIASDSSLTPIPEPITLPSTSGSLNPFIISEATTRAEVLWALKCI